MKEIILSFLANPTIIILLAILLGIGIPLGLVYAIRRRAKDEAWQAFRIATKSMRAAWRSEEEDLQELSRLVASIKAEEAKKED